MNPHYRPANMCKAMQQRFRRVFIAEKPDTARALSPFLRPGEIVLAAEGHLLEPKEPDEVCDKWAKRLPETLPILIDDLPLKVARNRSGRLHTDKLDAIAKALRSADIAVIATDSGREGSLIGWEILIYLGFRKTVQRLHLEAKDEASIRSAIARMDGDPHSGAKDYCVYKEGRARAHEDYHLGMNGSRAMTLWLKPAEIKGAWVYGGVLLPTLALLFQREMAIANFVPSDFIKIAMTVDAGGGRIVVLTHNPIERVTDPAVAEAIRAAAAAWRGAVHVKQTDRRRGPPKLFNLNSLQRRCAKLFGWTPQDTERVAQSLYDHGYATYPRTETSHLLDTEIDKAPAILAAIVAGCPQLADRIPAPDRLVIRKGHTYKPQSSEHFAIVPTVKSPSANSLSPQDARLYDLISRYFVANHLPDAVDAVTIIRALVPAAGPEREFSVRGSVERQPGWRSVFQAAEMPAEDDDRVKATSSDEEPFVNGLPQLQHGAAAVATGSKITTAQTKPPPRITLGDLPSVMARLIDLVEDEQLRAALYNPATPDEPKGLGAASSRKDIAPKLVKRGYIALLPGKDPPIQVTSIGIAVIKALLDRFPMHANPVARAIFEHQLSGIGRASSPQAADEAETAFRSKTFETVTSMIDALRGRPLDLDQEAIESATRDRRSGRRRRGPTTHRRAPTPPESDANVVSLRVPYERREDAKRIGARWQPTLKRWQLHAPTEAALRQARQLGFL